MDLFLAFVGLLIVLCVYLCIEFAHEGRTESKEDKARRLEEQTIGTGGLEFPSGGLLR